MKSIRDILTEGILDQKDLNDRLDSIDCQLIIDVWDVVCKKGQNNEQHVMNYYAPGFDRYYKKLTSFINSLPNPQYNDVADYHYNQYTWIS